MSFNSMTSASLSEVCAIRCLLPIGSGRFMHLVVSYGYQDADSDAEQLALTEMLFDAGLGGLEVVARGRPSLIVGDFNVEATKIHCLAKGISAGLWVDLEAAWALARESQHAVICKRTWDSDGGHRRDFMVLIGGLLLIWKLGHILMVVGGLVR